MKKVTVFILLVGLLAGSTMRAQLPNVPYVNYSTKTGVFTDARDGKTYAYKKYGDYEWFMQNLNWDGYDGVNESTRGSAGICSNQDPNGEKYGRFYNTATSGSKLCPEGWELSTQANWLELTNAIAGEYGVNIAPDGQYTIINALNYLRGGGLKSQHPDALWENDRGTLDGKADQIQFNLLPAGGFNGTNYISGEEIGKKAYFLIGGNDRFQNNTSDSRYDRNALRHIRTSNTYGSVRCVRFDGYPDVTITTPYPETIEIKQINSAEKERKRLAQAHKKYDHQPTGFYAEKGKKIIVNVEILIPSADNASPAVVVGTAGQENNTPKEISLRVGLNTIEATQHEGGLIYLRYVTDTENNPQGKARITFTNESEQVRAPQYIYNVTTDEEFASMLGKYRTPEVIFYSDYAIMVARHTHAIQYSMNENKQLWMDGVHLILEKEDEISGLDNNHPNALHHRMPAGEVRYLFVQNPSSSPHASPGGYTAYPVGSVNRYLTYNGTYNASWMLGHEVGHQHQQPAYMIHQSTESTVNLYAYYAERFIQSQKGNPNYNRTSAERWQAAQTTYLQLPVEERVYDMPDGELRALTGMDQNELRFMPWEQLFIIFGDDFYQMLHRITREEKVMGGSEQERRVYLIWKASQISGYDLRDFFNQWGIKPTERYYVNQVNTNIEKCLADGSIIPMPYENLHLTVTGQNRPSWAPLTLRGIASSSPSLDSQPEDRLASKNKYADYSTRKGVFTDTRDGKHYPYKTYGNKDWFMINLDWDGYNGTNEQTRGTVGVYTPNDPTGEVYGRMYPTNAGSAANNWCPPGWKYANESDFASLIDAVKNEYNLSSTEEVITGLKGGGDRDYFADGLWRKGGANINQIKAAEIGFNILPAGVFNKDSGDYDNSDEEGYKASFITTGWNHNIFTAIDNARTVTSRNSRHHASVRCIRDAATMIDQAITFEPIPEKTSSDPDFDLNVTASSGLPVAFSSSNENVATIINGRVHIVGSGTTIITVSQSGNDVYNPAPSVSQKLSVETNIRDLYCDYSTQTGTFTDPRDGKQYPYKTYGNKDWFMLNLDWDGYNGTDEQTKGTVGLYGSDDPNGKVYGRMYLTNAGSAANNWCPPGWTYAGTTDFAELITSVQAEYGLFYEEEVIDCLKGGSSKNAVADGLWSANSREINTAMAAEVGFNILPAGVFNKDAGRYDNGDESGYKASFVTSGWYHNVFRADVGIREWKSRNSRHYGSVRCVRNATPNLHANAAPTSINESVSDISFRIYPNPVVTGQMIYVKANTNTGLLQEATITVYDITGNVLISKTTKDSITAVEMPVVAGTYFVQVKFGLYRTSQMKVVVR